MISHRYRCIYVKMPKCASSSVLQWLLTCARGRYTDRPSWYPGPLEYRIVPTATAIELYPGYFTFTFLRNPYRRFLSLYGHAHRLVRAGAPEQPASYGTTLLEFAELCRDLLASTRGLWGSEALRFRARHAAHRFGPLGIPLRDLRFLTCHARPQVDFLPDCSRGRLFGVSLTHPAPLSFIGAVERLDEDVRRLQAHLGLPRTGVPRHNVSGAAPGLLDALRRDTATRRLIERIYAEDFAFAGYPPGDVLGRAATRRREAPPKTPRRAERVPPARRMRRALLRLAHTEIALEARIVRTPPVRRVLAPLSRWRRNLPLFRAGP